MSLVTQVTFHPFDKWVVDFMGPISLTGKRTSARYIIIVTNYLTRWDEAMSVKDCIAANFLFGNIMTRFGCPNILISDQGTHFVNQFIEELTEEFHIQHRKTTPYHPQANGVVEAFNKILENALSKICNVQRDDWDQKISAVLWAYHMT